MARLTVEIGVDEILPVEVRRPDLSLVARFLPSEEGPELEPGSYFVSCQSPGGETVSALADVRGETKVHLVLPSSGASSMLGSENPSLDQPSLPRARIEYDEQGAFRRDSPETHSSLRWHREILGFPWMRARRRYAVRESILDAVTPEFPWFPSAGSAGDERLTMIAGGSSDLYRLDTDPDGGYRVDLRNPEASAVTKYLQQGELWQAKTMLSARALSAEQLLRRKQGDPIAAAVGAYVLLQLGEVERLHDWTKNLQNQFRWLADGAVCEAERLALAGRHEEAAESLMMLRERDLPALSVGLAMVTDRLRLYTETPSNDLYEDVRALHLIEKLSLACSMTDWTQPLTTLRAALDPQERFF